MNLRLFITNRIITSRAARLITIKKLRPEAFASGAFHNRWEGYKTFLNTAVSGKNSALTVIMAHIVCGSIAVNDTKK